MPRSGWRTIIRVGTAKSSAATAYSRKRNDTSCRWKYRASISGIAIFMNSEGWRLAKPSGSHRRAPFLTSPNKATPASIRRTTTKAGIA